MAVGYAYIIPALLGAFTAVFLATATLKAAAQAISDTRRTSATDAPASSSQFEMRKAS